MDLLWSAERPLSVREAMDGLRPERELAYTTVMTVMDNLHRKRWLRRHRDGRAWRYAARAQPAGLHRAAHARRARGERRPRRACWPASSRRSTRRTPRPSPRRCARWRLRAATAGRGRDRRRSARSSTPSSSGSPDRRGSAARTGRCGRRGWARRRCVAAAWSVPVALVLAGVTVFLPASGLTIDVGHLIGACLGPAARGVRHTGGRGDRHRGPGADGRDAVAGGVDGRPGRPPQARGAQAAPAAGAVGGCAPAGAAGRGARAARGGRLRGRRTAEHRRRHPRDRSTCSAGTELSAVLGPRARAPRRPPPPVADRGRARGAGAAVRPAAAGRSCAAWAGCWRWTPTSSPRPATSRG